MKVKKGEAKIRAKQKREISDIAEKKRDKGAFKLLFVLFFTVFLLFLYCLVLFLVLKLTDLIEKAIGAAAREVANAAKESAEAVHFCVDMKPFFNRKRDEDSSLEQ